MSISERATEHKILLPISRERDLRRSRVVEGVAGLVLGLVVIEFVSVVLLFFVKPLARLLRNLARFLATALLSLSKNRPLIATGSPVGGYRATGADVASPCQGSHSPGQVSDESAQVASEAPEPAYGDTFTDLCDTTGPSSGRATSARLRPLDNNPMMVQKWLFGLWKPAVGLLLLASVGYGVFDSTHSLWAVAFILGVILVAVLLVRSCLNPSHTFRHVYEDDPTGGLHAP